jgi:CheY-like chemotaxis protein
MAGGGFRRRLEEARMIKKLLLADDSVTIQKVVGITFAGGGYEVSTVGDGDSALKQARTQRPDLVLADVFMPGKNGYDLCAALKEDSSLRDIPVLLLTGTFEPFDESKATQAGADGWVAKPFESQTLIKRVEELLARSAKPAREPAAPSLTPSVTDIWADLADYDIASEIKSSPEIPLPDFAESGEEDRDGTFFEFEPLEEEVLQEDGEGARDLQELLISSDDDSTVWELAPEDSDHEDFSEILLLSESDILEDELSQDLDFSPHFAEEANGPDMDVTATSGASAEPKVVGADQQDVPLISDDEASLASAAVIQGEDDIFADGYEEFSLEGFEDTEPEESLEALDLTSFESDNDDSDEFPADILYSPSTQDDPFQIGADDFLPSESPEMEDSTWGRGVADVDAVSPRLREEVPSVARLSAIEEKVAALSEEEIARIVERVAGAVIERLAQTMLERIAWEVVPDLAEVMIKEEIRKIREEVK